MKRCIAVLLTAALLFSLGCEAFADTLTLPSSTKTIEAEAFYGDASLDKVVLPEGVEAIGPRAFAESGVKRVYIPETVTEISVDAFDGTEGLTIVSSPYAYGEQFAEEHGIHWENVNPYSYEELKESLESIQDIPELIDSLSELDYAFTEIDPEGITDEETLELISVYNEAIRAFREELRIANDTIQSLKDTYAALSTALSEGTLSVSDSGYTVQSGNTAFTVGGDAYSVLSGNCEYVSSAQLEDGSYELTLRGESGKTVYLLIMDGGLDVSYQPHASSPPKRALRATQGSASSWIDNVMGKLGTFSDGLTVVSGVTNGVKKAADTVAAAAANLSVKGVLTATLKDTVQGAASIANGVKNAVDYVAETGSALGKTVAGIGSVAAGYSYGNYFVQINNLRGLKQHGHPNQYEVNSNESYELAMRLNSEADTAIRHYSAIMGVSTASLLTIFAPVAALPAAVVNLSLALTVGEAAEEAYAEAFRLDAMLHYRIEGTVLDEDTRQPLPYVAVFCECGGHERMQTVTDADGKYILEPLGDHVTLSFQKLGYEDASRSIPEDGGYLARDYICPIVTTLNWKGQLSGTLTDEKTHEPIVGATVALDGGRGTITDENGRYAFSEVERGAHTLSFEAVGYKQGNGSARLPTEQEAFDFTLEQDESSLWGCVTDADTGSALSGVKVTLNMAGGGSFTASTDEHGRYSFTEVLYDTHTLSFEKTGYQTHSGISVAMNLVGYTRYDVQLQKGTAPTSDFWTWAVTQFDTNGDGKLSQAEADAVTEINCSGMGFTSLEGIKLFSNLEHLYYNYIYAENLDVSGLAKLKSLECVGDENYHIIWGNVLVQGRIGSLKTLNVSGCSSLQFLHCAVNQLTSLNVSGCSALQSLICYYNQLTSLNVSGCSSLQFLACDINQLTSLNVSGCSALQYLSCSYNYLTSLNVSGYPSLHHLYCYDNQLTSLNVSGCSALEYLSCSCNYLTSLDLRTCPSCSVHCDDDVRIIR